MLVAITLLYWGGTVLLWLAWGLSRIRPVRKTITDRDESDFVGEVSAWLRYDA